MDKIPTDAGGYTTRSHILRVYVLLEGFEKHNRFSACLEEPVVDQITRLKDKLNEDCVDSVENIQ